MTAVNQVGNSLTGLTGTGNFVGSTAPALLLPSANNFISGYATTATAGSTTTLVVGSAYQQFFTGTQVQNVNMPVTSTVTVGQAWYIVNNSNQIVTVRSSGSNNILAMPAGTDAIITCISQAGTTAADWNAEGVSGVAGVDSITGTANQVVSSAATGAVTLSLPQSIATSSGVTFASTTFSSTSGIIGTTTNNSAAAGSVGEVISSVIPAASAVSITTATVTRIASVSLTAGDWDIWGNITFLPNQGVTVATGYIGWISTSSTGLPNPSLYNAEATSGVQATNPGLIAPGFSVSIASTTVYYLSCYTVFSVSTLSGCGGVYARRRR
jgi:hypothetical protein